MSKNRMNYRWYYAHQGLLSVLFVLRIIGVVGLIIQFINNINTANYFYIRLSTGYVILFVAIIIIGIARIYYTRKLNRTLKERNTDIYKVLTVYYVINVIIAFLYGFTYNYRVAIISALVVALIATPIIIYYRKRKRLFFSSDPFGEVEHKEKPAIENGWKCPKCGKMNSNMISICECGHEDTIEQVK